MSPSESDLINAKITARKRELHAEAVADVGRRLLDCQHNLVAEAQRLWSTGEMLARSYKQLSTELSDSIAAGDPLDTAILEKAKVALVQVPERLTSARATTIPASSVTPSPPPANSTSTISSRAQPEVSTTQLTS